MSMELKEEKRAFRREIKGVIRNIPDKMTRSAVFLSEFQKDSRFNSTNIVMSFSSLPDEVQLQQFNEFAHSNKVLLLPKINGEDIEIVAYNGEWKREDSYGILEPIGEIFHDLMAIDLIIVPGMAFDKGMNRLGRGKAYYDRFLPNTQAIKIGVCFAEQYVDLLPAGELDVLMDDVIRV